MSTNEKLGTCRFMQTPHKRGSLHAQHGRFCEEWREQPAQGEPSRKLALSEIPGSLLNDGITEVEVCRCESPIDGNDPGFVCPKCDVPQPSAGEKPRVVQRIISGYANKRDHDFIAGFVFGWKFCKAWPRRDSAKGDE